MPPEHQNQNNQNQNQQLSPDVNKPESTLSQTNPPKNKWPVIIVLILLALGVGVWATVRLLKTFWTTPLIPPADSSIYDTKSKPVSEELPAPPIVYTRLTDEEISNFAISLGSTLNFRNNAMIRQIFRGDLNSDIFSDAVVTIFSCDASCGERNYIIIDDDASPRVLDNARIPYFGYGAQLPRIEVLSIDDGVITVRDILEEKPVGTHKYKLVGEKIIEVYDISTWQTYRNEEYGFEFKYPEEIVLMEPATMIRNFGLEIKSQKPNLLVTIEINPSAMGFAG